MLPHEYPTMFRVEDAHWWYRALRHWLRGALSRYLPAGSRLLDAGCGTGATLELLRSSGYEAVGADLSAEALSLAGGRPGVAGRICRASVDRLPFADGAFDGVISLDLLYLLDEAQEPEALREFRRALKPGGVLVLHLPAYEWLRGEHDQAVATQRRYEAGMLKRKLSAAGFEVLRVEYRNLLFLPAVAVLRRVFRRGRTDAARATSDLTLGAGPLNGLLALAAWAEEAVGRWAPRPWGSSVCAVAKAVRAG